MPKAALKCRFRHFSAAFVRMDSFNRHPARQGRCKVYESEWVFMPAGKSRTYRLHLSEEGTQAFLECHYRLARIARRFIPYGTTLTVAILLLDGLDGPELVDEMVAPATQRLWGHIEHFVGASPSVSQAANKLKLAAAQSQGGPPVTATRLYAAGIALMRASEESEIADAYRRAASAFVRDDPKPLDGRER